MDDGRGAVLLVTEHVALGAQDGVQCRFPNVGIVQMEPLEPHTCTTSVVAGPEAHAMVYGHSDQTVLGLGKPQNLSELDVSADLGSGGGVANNVHVQHVWARLFCALMAV